MNMIHPAYLPHHRYNIHHQLFWQTTMKLSIGHCLQTLNSLHHSDHDEDWDQDVGSEFNGEAPESQPSRIRQSAHGPPRIPNRATQDASEEEVNDFPDKDDVIFSEFSDKIIAMAQDLARQNSKYSTNEILERSLNITIAAAKQLHFNTLSGWQIAMCEEKELVATDYRQPISGKYYKARKGFDGRYSQYVAEVYQNPEQREFYMKRAEEIHQKGRNKSQNQLTKFLHKLLGNELHLIVMAVPSKAKPILFTSAGFGSAYYKLIVQSSHGQNEYITTCAGGVSLQEAAKATTSTYNGTSGRNLMYSEIVQILKELISKNIYCLPKGNADERCRLVRFLQQNKFQWSALSAFGDTQQEITNNILSEVLGRMKMIHAAWGVKTLNGNQYTTVVLDIDLCLHSISNAQNFVTTFTTISVTANIRQNCSVSIFISIFQHSKILSNSQYQTPILDNGYPKSKIGKYLLVSNFTTTTTVSNITNVLERLFEFPAATMFHVSLTGRMAKSTIVETAAFGKIGGRKRATMNTFATNLTGFDLYLLLITTEVKAICNFRMFSIKIQIIFVTHPWLTYCSRRNGSVLNVDYCNCPLFTSTLVKEGFFPAAPRKPRTAFPMRLLQVLPQQSVRGSIFKSAWADGILAVYQSDHKTSLPNFARSGKVRNPGSWRGSQTYAPLVVTCCLSIMVEGNLISLPTKADHTKVVFQMQHVLTNTKLQTDGIEQKPNLPRR
ncbi:hypothetical protein BDD12DRAFT_802774 [Trichophaea hybrida]|nr:hypothetical protein BDD12DRAFT_802774 [Trichophaea hybrida]